MRTIELVTSVSVRGLAGYGIPSNDNEIYYEKYTI